MKKYVTLMIVSLFVGTVAHADPVGPNQQNGVKPDCNKIVSDMKAKLGTSSDAPADKDKTPGNATDAQ